MKIIRNIVVLSTKEDTIVLLKNAEPSVYDPMGETLLAHAFRVVTDLATTTFVLVPIGPPTMVRKEDFRPGDLEGL